MYNTSRTGGWTDSQNSQAQTLGSLQFKQNLYHTEYDTVISKVLLEQLGTIPQTQLASEGTENCWAYSHKDPIQLLETKRVHMSTTSPDKPDISQLG